MEKLLNKTAEGSARGITRWYALAHAARCGPCRRFLNALIEMLARLRTAKSEEFPDEAAQRLKSAAAAAAANIPQDD
jgi:hypothetical protein